MKQPCAYTTQRRQNGSLGTVTNLALVSLHQLNSYSKETSMRKRIKRRIKGTVNAVALGSVCCLAIYGTLLLCTAKSMLRMQTTRVDL